MCGLCGVLGAAAHWADGVALPSDIGKAAPWMRRQARMRSIALANAVTAGLRVRVSDWQGTLLMVAGPTGQTVLARDIGDLWDAIEKAAGRPIDPLDPELIDRIDG